MGDVNAAWSGGRFPLFLEETTMRQGDIRQSRISLIHPGVHPSGYGPEIVPVGYGPEILPVGYGPEIVPVGYGPEILPVGISGA